MIYLALALIPVTLLPPAIAFAVLRNEFRAFLVAAPIGVIALWACMYYFEIELTTGHIIDLLFVKEWVLWPLLLVTVYAAFFGAVHGLRRCFGQSSLETTPRRRWLPAALLTSAVVLALSVLVGIGWALYYGFTTVGEITRDCYAIQWVTHSMIDHLETHDGQWPNTWEDLRPSYKRLTDQAGDEVWSFDELRRRVKIDWNTNSSDFAGANYKAVWLADGREVYWEGEEPNQMIREFLRSRKNSPPKPTRLEPGTR